VTVDASPPLDLGRLRDAIARPARFVPHDAPFWDDPHISQGMLAAHLDPATDAASRRPDVVAATVDHLLPALGLGDGGRLIDLGCGPGLYSSAFAARGVSVTGIDLSARSIAHAVDAAARAGLAIDYRVGDYCAEDLGGPYDAAILVYLDLGVLDDAALDGVLTRVHAALEPGALFAFDVCSRAAPRVEDGRVRVAYEDGGFWRPGPHLLIETTYRFDRELDLTQVAVIEPGGALTAYRIWERRFTRAEIRTLLARHGFTVQTTWADLTGATLARRSPVLAVLARRGHRDQRES
jgi:SAM-dependent methyltransferase